MTPVISISSESTQGLNSNKSFQNSTTAVVMQKSDNVISTKAVLPTESSEKKQLASDKKIKDLSDKKIETRQFDNQRKDLEKSNNAQKTEQSDLAYRADKYSEQNIAKEKIIQSEKRDDKIDNDRKTEQNDVQDNNTLTEIAANANDTLESVKSI